MNRIEQLRTFLQTAPAEPFPRYALALELKGSGDPEGAARELELLVARTPDYLAAYLQLGMILQSLGRATDARSVLEKGQEVARNKGDQHTLSELTNALASSGA